jgi:hypothetical protein
MDGKPQSDSRKFCFKLCDGFHCVEVSFWGVPDGLFALVRQSPELLGCQPISIGVGG